MPSSNICLESLTGELDDFSFETYLGNPADPEVRLYLISYTLVHVSIDLSVPRSPDTLTRIFRTKCTIVVFLSGNVVDYLTSDADQMGCHLVLVLL